MTKLSIFEQAILANAAYADIKNIPAATGGQWSVIIPSQENDPSGYQGVLL